MNFFLSNKVKRAAAAAAACAMLGAMPFVLTGCGDESGASASGEKVIKMGMGSAWKDLIPYNNSSGGYYSGIVLGLLYDRLMYIGDDGKVSPRAADSWEFSDDKRTVTFHLNKNLKWSDGTPVTAKDYLFAAKMITDPDCPAALKSRMKILKGVNTTGNRDGAEPFGVEAPDDYTLIYKTDDPIDELSTFSQYMYDFLPIPEHLLKDMKPADYLKHDNWTHPVTDGPLAFDSMVAGSQLIMKANKDYHMGAPGFDKMIIQVMAPSNMASSLISGDIDLAYPTLTEDDVKTLEGSGKLKVVREKAPSQPYMVYVNQSVLPDKRIRQAMDKAIDREALAKLLQHAEPIETPIRKDSKYYDDAVKYNYDPAAAKAIFQSAVADGAVSADQEFVITTPPGIREKCANIIQQNMQAIGMNTKIEVTEAATMFAGFSNGKTEIALVNRSASQDPMYMAYHLTSNPPYWSHITYSLWDDYYKAYLNASDADKVGIVKDYQKSWLDDVPVIFYASTYKDYGYNPRIEGAIDLPDADYGNLPVWKWSVK